jgi:hypothetical protein
MVTPRQILVGLTMAGERSAALQLARRLAERNASVIKALLIEDEALAALAGLPFGREVSTALTEARRFGPVELQRQKMACMRTLQRDLGQLQHSLSLQTTVELASGPFITTVLAQAALTDFVIMAGSAMAMSGAPRLGGGAGSIGVIDEIGSVSSALIDAARSLIGDPHQPLLTIKLQESDRPTTTAESGEHGKTVVAGDVESAIELGGRLGCRVLLLRRNLWPQMQTAAQRFLKRPGRAFILVPHQD